MITQLKKLPRFQTEFVQLPSAMVNLVKLALLRISCPTRLSINGLDNIGVILDHQYWACVDSALNDMPLFAWLDFSVARSDLHSPVDCTLYSYHSQASLVINTVRHDMLTQLEQRLSARGS